MNYRDFECNVYKLNYELNIEKVRKSSSQQYNSPKFEYGSSIPVEYIANREVLSWPEIKITEKDLVRYKMILKIFIRVSFKTKFDKNSIEKELFEKEENNMLFEILKLSIPRVKEVINKSFEWMGFKEKEIINSKILNKVFNEISKKNWGETTIH